MRTLIRVTIGLLLAAGVPAAAHAQTQARDLRTLSLEDLMQLEITSASRREQRAVDTPAAVFVLTHEDIRRSGMTTVPDLLRLVPGVEVAQINANKWAVSVRGFNELYSNKLLVLIDGRTVYNRLYSGVLWDTKDLMIDDIERIEVVRGPGGAIWGANAVNGVINIITRPAAETIGTFLRVGAGTSTLGSAAVRYGDSLGRTSYRVFSQWTSRGGSTLPPGVSQSDTSRTFSGGGRLDWEKAASATMLEGEVTLARAHALWVAPTSGATTDLSSVLPGLSEMSGGSLTGRWERRISTGASLRVQSSFELENRIEPPATYRQRAGDVDAAFHATAGSRHDVVSGIGFRLSRESLDAQYGYAMSPGTAQETTFNSFAQDEVAIVPGRLGLTLGAKLERDTDVGWGVQPTVRLLWKLSPSQRIWSAWSRALRTPSATERYMFIQYAPIVSSTGVLVFPQYIGNVNLSSETVRSFEAGYRAGGSALHVDVATFVSDYDHLQTADPQPPSVVMTASGPALIAPVMAGSGLETRTYGLEAAAQWQPIPALRVDSSFSALHLTPRLRAGSLPVWDIYGAAPAYQWQVRSSLTPRPGLQLDLVVARVGALDHVGVPPYTRADARVDWPLSAQISLAIVGQNLSNGSHPEFAERGVGPVATLVPRSGEVRLVWRVP